MIDLQNELDKNRIVLLSGTRGMGKTTLLKNLASTHQERRPIYLNLEDPRFAPRPRKETPDIFLKAARSEDTTGDFLVLLDEVGRLEGWLAWARKAREELGVQVAASLSGQPRPADGLGAEDLSIVDVGPKSLAQWTREMTDVTVDIASARGQLPTYLQTGGIPSAWRSDDPADELGSLLHKTLFHDVVMRQEIRGVDKLTAIAVYLIAHTGRSVSASRIKGRISRSVDQSRAFLEALERSGLVHLVPRIEDAGRGQARAARRCFSCDTGLSVALASHDLEPRDLAETAVYHELIRRGAEVRAWKIGNQYGLATTTDEGVDQLIDVQWGSGQQAVHSYLTRAMRAHGCGKGLLLTDANEARMLETSAGILRYLPLGDWLLGVENLVDKSVGGPLETKDASEDKDLPVHLL